jgi:hypothetical protein
MALCTAIVGVSVGYAKGFGDTKMFNALGQSDFVVPEIEGFGGVALLTVVGAVGFGARKLYQKISGSK